MDWRALAVILGSSLALVTAAGASADIYQCKRADGSLHYTNAKRASKGCRVIVRGSRKAAPSVKTPAHKASPSLGKSGSRDAHRYDGLISEAASLYHLPESFIRAVMRVESNFNPDVVSHAGAMGLMQLMPRTARSMGVTDPFEPRQNVLGGARYLRILANRFSGDLILTVAAYNAGEGAVQKHNGIPPYEETQRYVRRVLKHYYAYRGDASP